MTIQQCRYALAIAKYGSFSEASKELYIAQSSLSVSIKSLEEELGITIFERYTGGVYLTEKGTEFIRYASNLCREHDFIISHYSLDEEYGNLYISTQHYDFVADVFSKFISEINTEKYRFALRETKTYDVINEVETAYSDIGIIAIKRSDDIIMRRYLSNKNLNFIPVIKAYPHVFVRKGHALSEKQSLRYEDLKNYPFVSYEQGEHSNSFFAEEITNEIPSKHIEISDRASLMNILLGTDCYTVGTGIMPSELNKGSIISIPYENEEYYTIGYIIRCDRQVEKLTKRFIDAFTKSIKNPLLK